MDIFHVIQLLCAQVLQRILKSVNYIEKCSKS